MNSCQSKNLKLNLKNISKSYDNTLVLKDISINVYENEFISILGSSGSGKSTIFNIITNLTNKDSGEIFINGSVSYMYQKDLLLPHKNIIDNVSMPLRIRKQNKIKSREAVKDLFDTFGLKGYEYKYPSDLSGGMKQRANLLRTYINSNDIMLLDEPFGALDYITKSNMQNWLLDMKNTLNSSILLITHDIDEAIMLSDRIYVISKKPSIINKEFIINKEEYIKDKAKYIYSLKQEILKAL